MVTKKPSDPGSDPNFDPNWEHGRAIEREILDEIEEEKIAADGGCKCGGCGTWIPVDDLPDPLDTSARVDGKEVEARSYLCGECSEKAIPLDTDA